MPQLQLIGLLLLPLRGVSVGFSGRGGAGWGGYVAGSLSEGGASAGGGVGWGIGAGVAVTVTHTIPIYTLGDS